MTAPSDLPQSWRTSAFEAAGVPVDGGYAVEDLRAIASRLKISGRSSMCKQELINAINSRLDDESR